MQITVSLWVKYQKKRCWDYITWDVSRSIGVSATRGDQGYYVQYWGIPFIIACVAVNLKLIWYFIQYKCGDQLTLLMQRTFGWIAMVFDFCNPADGIHRSSVINVEDWPYAEIYFCLEQKNRLHFCECLLSKHMVNVQLMYGITA